MINLSNVPSTVPRADLIREQIGTVRKELTSICKGIRDGSVVDEIESALSTIGARFSDKAGEALELAKSEAQRFETIHLEYPITGSMGPVREAYDNLVKHIEYYISGPKDVPVILVI